MMSAMNDGMANLYVSLYIYLCVSRASLVHLIDGGTNHLGHLGLESMYRHNPAERTNPSFLPSS